MTYKEHFQFKFPQEYEELISDIKKESTIQYNTIVNNYNRLIQQITSNINEDLQNINGKTIHSELQIKPESNNYISLAMNNTENRIRLRKIDVIIIDEISMVSPYLLDFINQMFCELHNSALPFGGIMVLIIADLA